MPTKYTGKNDEVLALDTFIKLVRAAETTGIAAAQSIRQFGLTEPQFAVLELLYHCGPLEQHIIARKMLRTGGNITYVLDRLERAGLVVRTQKSNDRRCHIVKITNPGKAEMKRIFPVHARRLTGLLSVLSETELTSLGKLCRKLGTSIQTGTVEVEQETDAD